MRVFLFGATNMGDKKFIEFVVTTEPMTWNEFNNAFHDIHSFGIKAIKEYDPSEEWRPAFEKWVATHIDDEILLDTTGKYTVSRIQFLWLGWKAARQNA
jgi:hypothetical protein